MSSLLLTNDQQAAISNLRSFAMDPVKTRHAVDGFSGSGKSTMVYHFLEQLPEMQKTLDLLKVDKNVCNTYITATTNKACQAFNKSLQGKYKVQTIYSLLGLKPIRGSGGTESRFEQRNGMNLQHLEDSIIIIDEASNLNNKALSWIDKLLPNAKIIYIGDPDQTIDHTLKFAPVYAKGYDTTFMKEPVRQRKGAEAITELSLQFKDTVRTGKWHKFKPDGTSVIHLSSDEFERRLITDFRHNKESESAKVLTWSNPKSIAYNKGLNRVVNGQNNFEEGDYVVCNSYFKMQGYSISAEQTVQINSIDRTTCHGLTGAYYCLDEAVTAFMPDSYEAKKQLLNKYRTNENYIQQRDVEDNWIDLRSAFSCTINKSQGSTYKRAYVDLNDVGRAKGNPNQLARLLYVGTSRASEQVIFTGDIA